MALGARRSRQSALKLGVALASTPVLARPGDEHALLRWLQSECHPIKDFASAASGLSARITTPRVIAIGEGTHGTHEDFAFKAELIMQLAKRGAIDIVAFEVSRRAGRSMSDFIEGRSFDRAGDAMRQGLYSIWRCQEVEQMLVALRDLNREAGAKIRIVGLDVQSVHTDLLVALSITRSLNVMRDESVKLVANLTAAPSGVAAAVGSMSESARGDLRSALDELVSRLSEVRARSASAEDGFFAALAARHGVQMLFGAEISPSGTGCGGESIAARDEGMAAIALEHAKQSRMAVWAHNGHVSREWPLVQGAMPMGYHLGRALGDGYFVVKFVWADGSIHATDMRSAVGDSASAGVRVFRVRNDEPGSLGHALLDAGLTACWIDLRTLPAEAWAAGFLSRPVRWKTVGFAFDERSWSRRSADDGRPIGRDTDVLVFFPSISPSRLLQ